MLGRLVLTLAAAACYAPHPEAGAACATGGICPSPLVCSAGLCEETAMSKPDAPVTTTDATACTPIADGAGVLTAPKIIAPKIDGDLTDWTTCFVSISAATNPTRDLGANGAFPSGRFSIGHDATHVYVAAEVMGIAPLGDQPTPAIYENNSISFYIDGDGAFGTQTYGSDGDQIVVDHAGRVQAFRSGSLATLPNLATGAKTIGTTYSIEIAVEASTFGLAAFGTDIGLDIGLEGGDGTTQTSEVLWFESCGPPTCGCGDGTAAPYCDEREFGVAHLAN